MMGDHGSMGDMPGWMGAGMAIAWIVWLLIAIALLVLVILAIAWLWTRLRGYSATGGRGPGAIDELNHRYAAGEIDRQTYLQMRGDLDAK